MTKKEAALFFRHEEGEDLHELWEMQFFKQKQYFLTHAPIPRVWKSKLKRLNNQFEAYLVLTDQELMTSLDTSISPKTPDFSSNFIETFHLFHQHRTKHKSLLFGAETPQQLETVVTAWLALEIQYAEYWSYSECEKNEIKVAQSQEPDPMELLKELKITVEKLGITAVEVLKANYNKLPEKVQKEVKRLTLLAK